MPPFLILLTYIHLCLFRALEVDHVLILNKFKNFANFILMLETVTGIIYGCLQPKRHLWIPYGTEVIYEPPHAFDAYVENPLQ